MSAPVIPPGGTIVQTFKQSFVDVPVDAEKNNAVATTQFLDAAESLTTIFGSYRTCPKGYFIHRTNSFADALGSVAFSPVKSDMLGNVKVCSPHGCPGSRSELPEATIV